MRTIDIHEARARLPELVEQAARGESFLITVSGTPRVKVLPLDALRSAPVSGRPERCRLAADALDPHDRAHIERRVAHLR
ncbi:type II toxin-antitoxin system prevent-host-death family antitoxin [Steroidobacter sp. S1-65]|uniref:Antitoxin n=2 Tax=Steroidobacter gossypii TaxID=2805490 RepID=A0ABS1WXT3_9GAMM|nr:type II toxin-antitoxin system prevent-host-death family antitoxin [Steroidobacter gossypii]